MRPSTRRRLFAVAKIGVVSALLVGTLLAAGTALAAPSGPPRSTGTVHAGTTIKVTGTFDGHNRTYTGGGDGSQSESQKAVFELAPGATVKNVLIGSPAGDGIHCTGSCTLDGVWWLDVGEDAATLEGSDPKQVMTIENGGAFHASDKVFQHNGPGTMVIRNMVFEDVGKIYRSCGNCSTTYARNADIDTITVRDDVKVVAGVNPNFGDRAVLSHITIATHDRVVLCQRYNGTTKGHEPTKISSSPDGKSCTVR